MSVALYDSSYTLPARHNLAVVQLRPHHGPGTYWARAEANASGGANVIDPGRAYVLSLSIENTYREWVMFRGCRVEYS